MTMRPRVSVEIFVEEEEIDEEYASRVGAWVMETAQREAERAGVPFDHESPLLKARIEIAVEDALSECDSDDDDDDIE